MGEGHDNRGRLWRPLRRRDFRHLIAAMAVSNVGSWLYSTVLIVYVYQRTHAPIWVGLVTVGRMLPSVAFGPYAGVLAERFERIRLMVILDVLSAALMAALTGVVAAGGPVGVAVVLAAVASLPLRVYDPAVAAVTPELVGADDLAAANTVVEVVAQGAILIGPGVGAVLLVLGSPATAFALNAASFVWSAVTVSRIRARSTPVDVSEGGSAGVLRQVLVGVRTLAGAPAAAVLAGYSIGASFVYGTDTVLFVALARHRLGLGSGGFGALMAATGIGSILGALLVPRLSSRRRLGPFIVAGMAAYTLPTLVYLLRPDPAIGLAVQVVRGGGTMVLDVLAVTALQRSVPKETLARVFGAFFTFVMIAISVGALLAPLGLRAVGLDGTLVLAGAGLPALGLLGWPALAHMDRANLASLEAIEGRVRLLRAAALLESAPQAVLERLAGDATELAVEAGTAVVVEGEEADAFYLIDRGELAVSWHGEGAAERDLPPLGPGDYFGEIGLLEGVPRTATVRAVTDCRLLRVDGGSFLSALEGGLASPTLLEGAARRLALTPARRPPTAPLPAAGVDG